MGARDRAHFFEIARASAQESASALDILSVRHRLSAETVEEGKATLRRVVSMLIKLRETALKRPRRRRWTD